MPKIRICFVHPLLDSLDLCFGLRYQQRIHMNFFNLESFFYGFATICQYMSRISKLRKKTSREKMMKFSQQLFFTKGPHSCPRILAVPSCDLLGIYYGLPGPDVQFLLPIISRFGNDENMYIFGLA